MSSEFRNSCICFHIPIQDFFCFIHFSSHLSKLQTQSFEYKECSVNGATIFEEYICMIQMFFLLCIEVSKCFIEAQQTGHNCKSFRSFFAVRDSHLSTKVWRGLDRSPEYNKHFCDKLDFLAYQKVWLPLLWNQSKK